MRVPLLGPRKDEHLALMTPSDPESLNPHWRPRARSDLVFRRVGDDWVLFDPASQKLHILNLTAALVWSFCTGALDVAGIERKVCRALGDLVSDPGVEAALADFRDARLLDE